MDSTTELESFKREIKLHEYAASIGYAVDQRESSKREIVMRAGGTILDLIKRRQGKNLGEALKILRVWRGKYRQMVMPAFEHLTEGPRSKPGEGAG